MLEKRQFLQQMAPENLYVHVSSSIKISSKWIKDLIITPETLSLEENIGKTLDDIPF
jgi:hypothetical protein